MAAPAAVVSIRTMNINTFPEAALQPGGTLIVAALVVLVFGSIQALERRAAAGATCVKRVQLFLEALRYAAPAASRGHRPCRDLTRGSQAEHTAEQSLQDVTA